MSPRTVTAPRGRQLVIAAGALLALLVSVVAWNSTRWIGATFPGFFMMANRVVPSIALPDWEAARSETLFQHEVLAIDDRPIATTAEAYERVAARPPGTPHQYLLRAPDGATATITTPARRFSGFEYALLFGAYLSTGIAFFLTGLIVLWLKRSPASVALFVQSLTTGIFIVTAADLYGPHWFFRLHVVAESMLAAGFIHLALVFPTDRLGARRARALPAVYLPFAGLAAVYLWALGSPTLYTTVHLVASASHGIGALAIIAAVAYDLATTTSPLVRRRVGVVALGTLGAFALPGALMAASAMLGGRIALNAGAFTAFVFPLGLGYAIVTRDLFEIDVVLRRAATYAVALAAIAACYLAALALLGTLLPSQSLSTGTMAILNLGFLFLMAPIKARAQTAVDRVFYRRRYDAEHVLSELSQSLSAAHTLADVERHTARMLANTLQPATATLLLTDNGRTFRNALVASPSAPSVVIPPVAVGWLAEGSIVSSYRSEEDGALLPPFWQELGAEIVVPIRSGRIVIGALALGRKESGRSYNDHDGTLLAAAASQVGLAIVNSRAFIQLADLNSRLEDQVRERTAALEVANRDLNRSYSTLESAFQQLEQSQASLMRADRLSTLGRLAASVAHEVNTPLGAVLNALQVLGNLGHEYRDSIGDAEVTADDHRDIAHEIVDTAGAAAGWARKAAAFITRVKNHGREPHPASRRPFTVRSVVDETRALLGQRLRLEDCDLIYEEDPVDVTLVGDPGRLGQVLVNLMTNALDAYEESHATGTRIVIVARATTSGTEIVVRDWAGGMPPEVVERIFDELFTTKDAGRGTGLGLSISRNLVEDGFGGTLSVTTERGVGSHFTLIIPTDAQRDEQHAAAVAS
ncbi:MAG: ATP-binding protein [Candidatus Binatia bacterium]